jgi:hypothetical protein
MRKMLIGIHDKSCSLRAVAYVMKQYPKGKDLDVTFVHVFRTCRPCTGMTGTC